jgi:ABC-type lipoprotein export system ATPase subunit
MQLRRRLTVERGKTAVVVTHDPRIQRYADRVFLMDSGRLVERIDGRTAQTPPVGAREQPLAVPT